MTIHSKLNKISILFCTFLTCIVITACDQNQATPTATSSPTPAPSTYCADNVANFSSQSAINLNTTPFDFLWGPSLALLPLPESLAACNLNAGESWQQERLLASADYWVKQQVNYCHHHVPTWNPAYELNGTTPNPAAESSYLECSTESDIMPPLPPNTNIRWNYTGINNQQAVDWYNPNSNVGYPTGNYGFGLDCSDYSKLNYAYAESIYFTSSITMQAGQAANESDLAPNMPGFVDSGESDILGLYSAGRLLCADGTVAPPRGTANSTSCNSHGGYISVFNSAGQYVESAITDDVLNLLKPGDLLYIAGSAYDNDAHTINPLVTHVIMWTGQKIGQSSYISESQIAPETDIDSYGFHHGQCNHGFWASESNIGNWIITDSHYQGPDYRAFTYCFYRNQIWGIRRVLGGYQ